MSDIVSRKVAGEHMMVLRTVKTERGWHYATDCITCGTVNDDGTRKPKRLHEFHAEHQPAAVTQFEQQAREHMTGSAVGQHITNLLSGFGI